MSIQPRVYVVQEVPGRNLTSALEFGNLVPILGPNTNIQLSTQSYIEDIYDALIDFRPNVDYLLLIGDPLAIAIAFHAAARVDERVTVLKWDRETKRYYAVIASMSSALSND